MFKPLNLKKRIVKNETGAYIWKVGNGYKMSRIAKQLLGIPADQSSMLTIAYDDEADIVGIGIGTEDEQNCSVSKLNIITSKDTVSYLESLGTNFRLSDDKTEEGYYIMTVVNTVDIKEEEQEDEEEEVVESEETLS